MLGGGAAVEFSTNPYTLVSGSSEDLHKRAHQRRLKLNDGRALTLKNNVESTQKKLIQILNLNSP